MNNSVGKDTNPVIAINQQDFTVTIGIDRIIGKAYLVSFSCSINNKVWKKTDLDGRQNKLGLKKTNINSDSNYHYWGWTDMSACVCRTLFLFVQLLLARWFHRNILKWIRSSLPFLSKRFPIQRHQMAPARGVCLKNVTTFKILLNVDGYK